eukprot:SAG11_NODE_30933_length_296_cov_0.786802_1_plen_24_part_01
MARMMAMAAFADNDCCDVRGVGAG